MPAKSKQQSPKYHHGNFLSAAADRNEQALLGLGEAYVGFALSNPALYRLMFGEGFASTSQAGGEARNLRQTVKQHMLSLRRGFRVECPGQT